MSTSLSTPAICKRCGATDNIRRATLTVPGLGTWTFVLCDEHMRDAVHAVQLATLPSRPALADLLGDGGDEPGGAISSGELDEQDLGAEPPADEAKGEVMLKPLSNCEICGRLTADGTRRCGYHKDI